MARITIGKDTADVNLDRLPLHQGIALQRATGMKVQELGIALEKGDMVAFAALAWLVLKFYMNHPDLTFDDVCEGKIEIPLNEINIEATEEEAPSPTVAAEAAPI